jgi:hypothetical protein
MLKVAPGDTRPCELYSSCPIFAKHTGNHVFCFVEEETILKDQFIRDYKLWETYAFGQLGVESFLRQQYGMYRANLAAKVYKLS